jgi:hypothetical protein
MFERLGIGIDRICSWQRLIHVTALVFRAVGKFKAVGKKKVSSVISTEELNASEWRVFKWMQMDCFKREYKQLSDGGVVEKSSPIFRLNPYINQEGVVRLCGRLDAAPKFIPKEMRNPILLGRGHRVTQLIIESVHKKFAHSGCEMVVNLIREKYWIPKIRTEVNRILRICNACQFRRACPEIPKMANLPKQRLSAFCPPFSYTGCDYFGPLEVTVGRRKEKRYGVLFTCLSTRAIHLELVTSLDTDSCILAIRNFLNRRGPPVEIWSDNGTNFKGAERELREAVKALDQNRIITDNIPVHTHIKWRFNPPSAPPFGGAWE